MPTSRRDFLQTLVPSVALTVGFDRAPGPSNRLVGDGAVFPGPGSHHRPGDVAEAVPDPAGTT